MTALQLELVTPEALFFSGTATQVEVPGELGDFGVLPEHAPFVSLIRPGVVTIHTQDAGIKRLFVLGGVAEVNPAGCTILAERVRDITEFSAADAQSHLAEAKQQIEQAITDEEKTLAERALKEAEAIVEWVG